MNTKKLVASILCLVLCIAMMVPMFASCGDKNKDKDTATDAPSNTEAPSDSTNPGETEKPGEVMTPPSEVVVNDDFTLILQSATFDGVFNPFFASSAYDVDVTEMVNVGLLLLDPSGTVIANDNRDSVAKDYSIYYTNDLTNYTKKDTYAAGDYVVYEMVIKNGMKFSDGHSLTADDVLFNYYVYLDPAYNGSSTLYTLPILGMTDYRMQVPSASTYIAKTDKIFAAGETYKASSDYTQEEFTEYWNGLNVAGKEFALEIVNYVMAQYCTADNEGTKYMGAFKATDFTTDGMKTALGMAMWGFGGFDAAYVANATGTNGKVGDSYKTLYTKTADVANATFKDLDGNGYVKATAETATADCVYITGAASDEAYNVAAYTGDRFDKSFGKTFTDSNGKNYDMTTTFPTVSDYWDCLKAGYADDKGVVDYTVLSDTESAGMNLISRASEKFIAKFATAGKVENISGLVKGEKTINGEKYETVKIILTEQNPKAILSLGVLVAPMHYYTAGYTYSANCVKNYGVELGITTDAFIKHLATFDRAPMGAGVYKYTEFKEGDVYFERNDYHYTMGNANVYNANIKKVCMKAINSGVEYDALTAGDVHYAEASTTEKVMADISKRANIDSILVDNLGYGYICINPNIITNLYVREALSTVFNLEEVKEYYPEGLADIIYRSMSQVNWAYPENCTAAYPYDESLKTTIELFKKAGYTYDEASKKFTDVPEFVFNLPSDAKDHPAGGIFITAQKQLEKIGIAASIKVDDQLIANTKTGNVGIYALAWQATADPDLYQVYHYESSANSVIGNGIKALYTKGTDAALGTVEFEGKTLTQTEALARLGDLIVEGTKYMSKEERKPIYEKALDLLAKLAIEIPTYQRKNMYAFDNTIIDGTTLSKTVSPYWGPMAEIWKVSFASGVAGNKTVKLG